MYTVVDLPENRKWGLKFGIKANRYGNTAARGEFIIPKTVGEV
jgi:hypothetical protein